MNKVLLWGHVGADPDVKTLPSGTVVAKFSLATSSFRKGENGEKITETDWHNVECWEKQAELVRAYVKKGSALIVEGRIKYRSYEDQAGNKKYFTEILASNIHFTGKKDEAEEDKTGSAIKDGESFYPVGGRGKQPVKSLSDPKELFPPNVANYDEIPQESPDDLPF